MRSQFVLFRRSLLNRSVPQFGLSRLCKLEFQDSRRRYDSVSNRLELQGREKKSEPLRLLCAGVHGDGCADAGGKGTDVARCTCSPLLARLWPERHLRCREHGAARSAIASHWHAAVCSLSLDMAADSIAVSHDSLWMINSMTRDQYLTTLPFLDADKPARWSTECSSSFRSCAHSRAFRQQFHVSRQRSSRRERGRRVLGRSGADQHLW